MFQPADNSNFQHTAFGRAVCLLCKGEREVVVAVNVTQDKNAPNGLRVEKRACPQCGGTGCAGYRTK